MENFLDLVVIRQGTIAEMKQLWIRPNTTEFFEKNLCSNNALFWTVSLGKDLIAELYVSKKLDDLDFANGTDTVYLCAFRVNKIFRGKGLGQKLMHHVFEDLKNNGYKQVTIGVEPNEKLTITLYEKLGFKQFVKVVNYDPCDVDQLFEPVQCEAYYLLKKSL
ncbi:MAG: GNAT family N-acetyltransferase [Candidatus Izemoplasmataceae bacterium]